MSATWKLWRAPWHGAEGPGQYTKMPSSGCYLDTSADTNAGVSRRLLEFVVHINGKIILCQETVVELSGPPIYA